MNFLYNLYWALDQLSFLPRKAQLFRNKRIEIHNKLLKNNPAKNSYMNLDERHETYLTKEILKSLPHDRPVVFRGLGKNGLAEKKWSFNFFKEKYGETEQPFFRTIDGKITMDMLPVKEGLPDVLTGNPPRLLFGGPFDLLNIDPKLRDDLELERLTDTSFFNYKFTKIYKLFFAGKDQWATSHSEFGDTLNFVVKGQKRWTLFSPKNSPYFLPEVSRNIFIRSKKFANASELRDGPYGLNVWDITLNEGDAIFCPSYFWHFIETTDDAISAEYKWGTIPMLLRHPLHTGILLTATNPSMRGQFKRIANPSMKPNADIFD